jgi:hypothetical protein
MILEIAQYTYIANEPVCLSRCDVASLSELRGDGYWQCETGSGASRPLISNFIYPGGFSRNCRDGCTSEAGVTEIP